MTDRLPPLKTLRARITLLETSRDIRPTEWNAAKTVELLNLKTEWARRTGRDWRSV